MRSPLDTRPPSIVPAARSAGRETSADTAPRATAVRPVGTLAAPSAAVGHRLTAPPSDVSCAKTAGAARAKPSDRAAAETRECVRMAQQVTATFLPELACRNAERNRPTRM